MAMNKKDNFYRINIPVDLRRKHTQKNVVFFCGAGISKHKLGLPLFDELIDEILKRRPNIHLNQAEEKLKKNKEWDKLLGSLTHKERYGDNFDTVLRKTVHEILSKELDNNLLGVHRDLLDLSKHDGMYRIVTTNFDRAFVKLADEKKINVFSYPTLPIPNNSLNGIFHLHGLLPENLSNNKDELKNLVLTFTNFSLAYLINGNAREFIIELLRRYTICFIGYSADDLIIRYILDAYLILSKYSNDTKLYAFAGYDDKKNKKNEVEQQWRMKNVEPITYFVRNKQDHSDLYNELKKWKEDYLYGELVTASGIFKQSPNILNPSDKSYLQYFFSTRRYEEYFLNEKNHPSVEWLKILDSEIINSILEISICGELQKENQRFKLSFFNSELPLDPVREYLLKKWIFKNLDNPILLTLVVNSGCRLNSQFRIMISEDILGDKNKFYNKSCYIFWELILFKDCSNLRLFNSVNTIFDDKLILKALELDEWNLHLKTELFKLISTFIVFTELSRRNEDKEYEKLSDIFDIKIRVKYPFYLERIREFFSKKISFIKKEIVIDLLLGLTEELKEITRILELVQSKEEFYFKLQEGPHQDRWESLALFALSILKGLSLARLDFVEEILKKWMSLSSPLFYQLVCEYFIQVEQNNTSVMLEYIFSDRVNIKTWILDSWVKFSNCYVSDLLSKVFIKIWSALKENDIGSRDFITRLTNLCKNEDDRRCILRYMNLFKEKRKFSDFAQEKFDALKKETPSYKEGEEKDIKPPQSRCLLRGDLAKNSGLELPDEPQKAYQKLLELEKEYPPEFIQDAFYLFCKKSISNAVNVLNRFPEEKTYLWHPFLEEAKTDDKDARDFFIKTIKNKNGIPTSLSKDQGIQWRFANYYKNIAEKCNDILIDDFSKLGIKLIESICAANKEHNVDLLEEIYRESVNKPVGIVMLGLMFILTNKVKDKNLITSFLKKIEYFLEKDDKIIWAVKNVLGMYVPWLIQNAFEWTKEKLLSKFELKDHSWEWLILWDGYLFGMPPGESDIQYLKVKKIKQIVEYNWEDKHKSLYNKFQSRLAGRLAYCFLSYPDVYSSEEKKILLNSFNSQKLHNIAGFMFQQFDLVKSDSKKIADSKKIENFLKNSVTPILKIWPSDKEHKNNYTNNTFLKIFFDSDQSFDTICNNKDINFLEKITHWDSFFCGIDSKIKAQAIRHPDEVFQILCRIFNAEQVPSYPNDVKYKNFLKEILLILKEKKPTLEKDNSFKKLENVSNSL